MKRWGTVEVLMDIKATVRVIHFDDYTVDFTVWMESGEITSGSGVPLAKAAHQIGSAFLLEGDDRSDPK